MNKSSLCCLKFCNFVNGVLSVMILDTYKLYWCPRFHNFWWPERIILHFVFLIIKIRWVDFTVIIISKYRGFNSWSKLFVNFLTRHWFCVSVVVSLVVLSSFWFFSFFKSGISLFVLLVILSVKTWISFSFRVPSVGTGFRFLTEQTFSKSLRVSIIIS